VPGLRIERSEQRDVDAFSQMSDVQLHAELARQVAAHPELTQVVVRELGLRVEALGLEDG
jgi:hypothetical protein